MLTRLTSPLSEPITLVQLKTYLKLEYNDDDILLSALLATARVYLENQLHSALFLSDYRLTYCCPPRKITLPISPLATLTAVNKKDSTGLYQPLDPTLYKLCDATLTFTPEQEDIEILFSAGYATPPEPLLLALQMLVSHWYDNRAVINDTAGLASLPLNINALISPFKRVRLI